MHGACWGALLKVELCSHGPENWRPISGMWGLFRSVCDKNERQRPIIEGAMVILACFWGLFNSFMSLRCRRLGVLVAVVTLSSQN